MTKTAAAGSESISQRHGSSDPDPYQNVTDPEHPDCNPGCITQLPSSQQMCTVTFSAVDSECLARNLIFPSQIQGQKAEI
jgi:hypothetical protein